MAEKLLRKVFLLSGAKVIEMHIMKSPFNLFDKHHSENRLLVCCAHISDSLMNENNELEKCLISDTREGRGDVSVPLPQCRMCARRIHLH